MRLNNQRILVTGGASGIGAEIARRFMQEGANLALLDIDLDRLSSVARECRAYAIRCDVAAPNDVNRAVTEAAADLNGLDCVVNCAGILARQPFMATEGDVWQRLFEINLLGPALVIKSAFPALCKSQAASVLNISSLAGIHPSPGTAAYGATKAALLMLSKSLALEIAPIRVNAICPGIVETPMTADLMADQETRDYLLGTNVLHAMAKPRDVADAAVYLSSAEAKFVTGTQIVIDGGSSFA